MTSHNLPTDPGGIQRQYDYFWNRLQAIEKNHGTDEFCAVCLQPNPIGAKTCRICGGEVLDRLQAKHIAQGLITAYGAELRKLKKAPPAEKTGRTEKATNPDEEIRIVFADGTKHTARDAKTARKYLRGRGLSVNQAVKEGQTWKFN